MHRFLKWREALNLAPNVTTVESLMLDYIDTLVPLLPALPDDCRRALVGPLDIQGTAVVLMQAEMRFHGSDTVHDVLHEAAHTFGAAAVRITQLHGSPVGGRLRTPDSDQPAAHP